MLDIGVIIPELRKRGGAERFLIECLVRWQTLHHLTLYATAFDEGLFEEVGLVRVQLRKLTPHFGGEHATLLNATLLPKIWETEVGHHDIYHTHLWPTHLLNLSPMVWYPHEPLRLLYDLSHSQVNETEADDLVRQLHFYPKEKYDTVLDVQFNATMETIRSFDQTRMPERIVANSRYTARYLEAVYGQPVPDVIYPGVTSEDLIDLPQSGDLVLTIGQFWPHKRMRLIVEAISEVEGVQLYIAGSGPDQVKMKQIAERMGVADRVFFLSGLDNQEVRILLARCLCVVFTPVREPFGIVALEALAAGKPLIAVNEGGFTEVVDSDCACLVPPYPGAIAQEIRRLKDDPDLARRMGQHGRNVAAAYSWDRTATELIALIEDTHQSWRRDHVNETPRRETLFVVHYFLWYREGFGSGHWCDNPATGWVTDSPALGYYGSIDGDILTAHLDEIVGMGIDVVSLNIHVNDTGLDTYQFHSAQKMQDIAARRHPHLRFLVTFCVYTDDPTAIETAYSILHANICQKPNYLTFDGKIVVLLFWTGTFDADVLIIDFLQYLLKGTFCIGVFLTRSSRLPSGAPSAPLFDAACSFSPLELGAPDDWESIWQAEFDASGRRSGLTSVTLCPGYDDTHLLNPARAASQLAIARADGETYRRMMDFALAQAAPSLVFISTFNEYHENTHIERSRQNGSRYIDMTRDFIAAARAKWAAAAEPAGSRAP